MASGAPAVPAASCSHIDADAVRCAHCPTSLCTTCLADGFAPPPYDGAPELPSFEPFTVCDFGRGDCRSACCADCADRMWYCTDDNCSKTFCEEHFLDGALRGCNDCGSSLCEECGKCWHGSFCEKCETSACGRCSTVSICACYVARCLDCGGLDFCTRCGEVFCDECTTLMECTRSLACRTVFTSLCAACYASHDCTAKRSRDGAEGP